MTKITKKILKKISLFFLMAALSTPSFVYGETTTGDPPPIKLPNPLKVDSITDLLELILQIVTIFAVPIIVFFIIYAGFLYVTAQGNETKLTKAHSALLYSIIGGVIILGAYVLLAVIQGTVGSLLAP